LITLSLLLWPSTDPELRRSIGLNLRGPRLQVPTAAFPNHAHELLCQVAGVGQLGVTLAELLQQRLLRFLQIGRPPREQPGEGPRPWEERMSRWSRFDDPPTERRNEPASALPR
jgi:hypothetical protein